MAAAETKVEVTAGAVSNYEVEKAGYVIH